MRTPKELGFRMPAEWEPHDATWLAWPTDPETFPPEIIRDVERTYVSMIQALCDGEKVCLLVDDAATRDRVVQLVGHHKNFSPLLIKTQDVWIRDYGPTFVTNGKEVAMNIWRYNAYGEKWPELMSDDKIAGEIKKHLRLRSFDAGIFLEGGAIEVNGHGTCLTTTSCLLNKNRNVDLDRKATEKYLCDFLNVENVLWLPGGNVAGDDTDGHIDNIARFVNPTTILCIRGEGVAEENYNALSRQRGSFDLGSLPIPKKVANKKSGELPASYANFYIGNRVVLVPTYGGDMDNLALSILKEHFPKRDVVGIDAHSLVWGFGSIHCVTQQQPAPERQ